MYILVYDNFIKCYQIASLLAVARPIHGGTQHGLTILTIEALLLTFAHGAHQNSIASSARKQSTSNWLSVYKKRQQSDSARQSTKRYSPGNEMLHVFHIAQHSLNGSQRMLSSYFHIHPSIHRRAAACPYATSITNR